MPRPYLPNLPGPCALAATVLAALLPLRGPATAAGADITAACPGVDLHVAGASATEFELVCDGLRRAVGFFRRHAIPVEEAFRVRLTEGPMGAQGTHIGQYDTAADRIDLLTLARARELCAEQSPFRVPMDVALYTSFVAHEATHVVVERRGETGMVPLTQEYLAYVVQLATMDADLRQRILDDYPMLGFADTAEISWVYYGLDPAAFGVKSFRHFSALPDPAGFIADLLSGAVEPGGSWY